MNRDRKKLTALLCLCVAFAVVILISNNGLALQGLVRRPAVQAVTLLEEPVTAALQVTQDTTPRAAGALQPRAGRFPGV